MIPALLLCVLVLAAWIHYESKKSSSYGKKDSETFWQKEHDADFVRKKDISGLPYIAVPLDLLPLGQNDPSTSEYEAVIQELAEKKILNLTGITNTELKQTYGSSNLEELASYDQNFTLLARTLFQWGKALLSLNHRTEAITVLEFGISCHTDVSGNYALLASLYREDGNIQGLNQLLETASTLDSLSKDSILENVKRELNGVF